MGLSKNSYNIFFSFLRFSFSGDHYLRLLLCYHVILFLILLVFCELILKALSVENRHVCCSSPLKMISSFNDFFNSTPCSNLDNEMI